MKKKNKRNEVKIQMMFNSINSSKSKETNWIRGASNISIFGHIKRLLLIVTFVLIPSESLFRRQFRLLRKNKVNKILILVLDYDFYRFPKSLRPCL